MRVEKCLLELVLWRLLVILVRVVFVEWLRWKLDFSELKSECKIKVVDVR